jgi:gliding motility-associated lipoprotein GldH
MYYKPIFNCMKSFHKIVILPAVFSIMICACHKIDVFEKNVPLKEHRWLAADKPSIQFNITDTASLYNIFVVVRHSDAYRYNNLWLNVYTKAPGDSASKPQALDLPLASNEKGWLGTGMDDIYEHRIRISQAPVALKAGMYQFQLEQIMRDDPLEHIFNVGIRVERAPN